MRSSVVLGLLGLFSCACEGGTTKPQTPPQRPTKVVAVSDGGATADADPTKLEGAALYTTYCSQCHGPDAKGYKSDNAPSLVNPTFLESATDDFIAKSIAVGRPGTSMAPYGSALGGPLDQAAVDRIVTWIRTHGVAPRPLGTVTAGDSTRGSKIYSDSCQKCHGQPGLRINAVHLANPQFLNLASDAFIRYAVMMGRPGTPMESFATKLSTQDIDDVVTYVRTFANPMAAEGTLPPPTGKEPLILNPTGKDPIWKKTTSDPNSKQPRYVPVDEVKAALDAKKRMVIIDARPPSDWMRVHITGAVSIPYFDPKRLDEIPADVWVLAYCACPHHLSGEVVDELWKRGHKKALVIDEGILEWHRRGYPVVAAEGVKPPPKEQGGPAMP